MASGPFEDVSFPLLALRAYGHGRDAQSRGLEDIRQVCWFPVTAIKGHHRHGG